MIKAMNAANVKIRRSHELNGIFLKLKCRLKTENLTRWSSTLFMLLSVMRAYKCGAFDGIEYPVPFQVIELYVQLLLPAYKFSLLLQRQSSSISDVIPGLLYLINFYEKKEKLDIDQEYTDLCHLLIHFLKLKFEFELNSPIYQVNL